MVKVAKVYIWNTLAGAVLWNEDRQVATFEYDTNFMNRGMGFVTFNECPFREGAFTLFLNYQRRLLWVCPGYLLTLCRTPMEKLFWTNGWCCKEERWPTRLNVSVYQGKRFDRSTGVCSSAR